MKARVVGGGKWYAVWGGFDSGSVGLVCDSPVYLFADEVFRVAAGTEGIRKTRAIFTDIRVVRTNAFAADRKGIGKGALSVDGMAAFVVEVLLVVERFEVDVGAEGAVVEVNIHVQKSDVLRGDVPGELDRELGIESVKKVVKGSNAMGSYHEDVVDKPPPAERREGFIAKEIFFEAAHVQISIGRCHPGAHGSASNLEIVLVKELEVVLGEDVTGQVG